MNHPAKVVWSEGMFLRPHHFQQSESYFHHLIHARAELQHPWQWGFFELEINHTLLRQGKLALNSARGLLPDGTYFCFHDGRDAPAPLFIADHSAGAKVVLALPARRGGREEVIFDEAGDSLARFVSFEQEVEDVNAVAVGQTAVQFGRLRLKLMLESELSAEWTALGVARFNDTRSENQLRLDPAYIPPLLNSSVNATLRNYLHDLQTMLTQRCQQLGQRLQQPGRFNQADTVDFMLLALLNYHSGQLSHLKHLPLLHPEQLWRQWLAFACELTTYTPRRFPDQTLPEYCHDDLARCFAELMLMLRHGLSQVLEEHAIQLVLTERSHGLSVATVSDQAMIREFGFVLAVRADIPGETLHIHFPAQMKIAPVAKIRDLVHLQLPGLVLRAMPTAPPQIPWHAGYSYFELEKGGELWKEMEKSGAFALHLAGDFPGLEMQFWAIRSHSV
ncbi:type VI secretion system baseplate subunit TssK [Winslowiella iniecta]|uniref:Type VI secretion protein n=1 Tax=Winslowiella iniecta TaxID=1560201 RepID=A0A0L7T2K3_9GAMM|nr:type VI secretion system baseplate subunit TssK [Winslowiella iniecta]KOC88076.1 type VI secretion protein [Winslowiella iniecta]KOC89659.1 type VI secretion protein [Winslowiella iniecta]